MNKEVTIDIENPKDNDLISRQAVLDLAKKGVLVSNGNYKSVCKAINEMPSVNPTKIGHWKLVYRECGTVFYLCSRCNEGRAIIDGDNYKSLDEFKICPNCGARMIESEEV